MYISACPGNVRLSLPLICCGLHCRRSPLATSLRNRALRVSRNVFGRRLRTSASSCAENTTYVSRLAPSRANSRVTVVCATPTCRAIARAPNGRPDGPRADSNPAMIVRCSNVRCFPGIPHHSHDP